MTLYTRALDSFRYPAEFEEQEAVWLGWPVYEIKKGLSSVPLYLELIEALALHMKVRIAVQDDEEKAEVIKLLQGRDIPLEEIELFIIPHDDIWFRDMGPIFLVGDDGKLVVQKFEFNGWGYEATDSDRIARDQQVPALMAQCLGLKLLSTSMISEGGDREFNGKGTLITVEAVELQRNPGMTRDSLESEFKCIFNVDNVVWLKNGLYEDTLAFDAILPGPDGRKNILTCITTGGHIDEHCRFVSEDTLLVAEVTKEEADANPIAKVNRERLEENMDVLRKAVGPDGKPFHIVRIPLPDPLFTTMHSGDGVHDYYKEKYKQGFIYPLGDEINVVAAASYNNFFIGNNAVFAPRYWKPGLPWRMKEKDDKAAEVLRKLFPGYTIHTLDVSLLNFGGGGIHCITQQEPVSGGKHKGDRTK